MTEAPIKLAGYFLEWQLIEDAKSDLADKSKDLFKVMKDEGYDTKAARAVFREKRAELNATSEDVAKAEEAEAIQDLYRAALDSGLTARAGRAREEQPVTAHKMDRATEGSFETGSVAAGNARKAISAQGYTSPEDGSVSHAGAGESPADDGRDVEAAGGTASVITNSQSAETPTADKPEAHAQHLSASGALSDEDVPAFLKREVAA